MKQILFILFLFPLLSSAQKNKDFDVDVESAKTYGYVNGIRLDSINSLYAQVELLPTEKILTGAFVKRYAVDYGQKWDKVKEVRLTNKEGLVLTFSSISLTLNLFDYNGWDLVDMFNVDTGKQMIFFKKKQTAASAKSNF
jgi:hypothetical protein